MDVFLWAFGGIGATIAGLLLGKKAVSSIRIRQNAKAGNGSVVTQIGGNLDGRKHDTKKE
jgi:hypothetical protein